MNLFRDLTLLARSLILSQLEQQRKLRSPGALLSTFQTTRILVLPVQSTASSILPGCGMIC
jgi:hypothetical protein